MQRTMETVSVIIPVYNSKEYLEECVASVVAVNTFCSNAVIQEIILVDDGSLDGSSEQCDRIALAETSKRCNVHVIHQTNNGVSAARNRGLHEAKGTFVFFVDSDDTIESQMFAQLMDTLALGDSVDMAVFGMTFDYYSGERMYRQAKMLSPLEGIRTVDDCVAALSSLYANNMISSLCNKVIRRSVIEKAGLFLREDMFLYEDLEFALRVLTNCSKILFFKEAIYRYRQAADENNAGRRLKRIAHIPEITDKIEKVLVPYGDSSELLFSLYMVLAREKISVASKEEIKTICCDYRSWIDRHRLEDIIANNKQAKDLYNGNVLNLLARREKTKIRHKTANWIKRNFGDYRNKQ